MKFSVNIWNNKTFVKNDFFLYRSHFYLMLGVVTDIKIDSDGYVIMAGYDAIHGGDVAMTGHTCHNSHLKLLTIKVKL